MNRDYGRLARDSASVYKMFVSRVRRRTYRETDEEIVRYLLLHGFTDGEAKNLISEAHSSREEFERQELRRKRVSDVKMVITGLILTPLASFALLILSWPFWGGHGGVVWPFGIVASGIGVVVGAGMVLYGLHETIFRGAVALLSRDR